MKLIQSIRIGRRLFASAKRVNYITGSSQVVSHTKDVLLRGIHINGNQPDLPTLIFFPDLFDSAENWVPFFLNPRNRILDYRNVYILYPRNFGSSDYFNDEADFNESTVADIERFMYVNKLTMATVGGHGFGARNAALLGCYKPHLLTGLFALDYAPQDYTYFQVSRDLRNLLRSVEKLDLQKTSIARLKETVETSKVSPKLQKLIVQSLRRSLSGNEFGFNMPFLLKNFGKLIDWRPEYGLFPGRACFIFPEYSNYVFLNSNTISMHKVCPALHGFEEDIFMIRYVSDSPDVNHWMYEDQQVAEQSATKLVHFLAHYDGVHLLLKNRMEVLNRHTIPVLNNARIDRLDSDVAPAHVHHNWRFRSEKK